MSLYGIGIKGLFQPQTYVVLTIHDAHFQHDAYNVLLSVNEMETSVIKELVHYSE